MRSMKPRPEKSSEKNDPLALEKKAMAKKEAEFEKKIAELTKNNETLQTSEDKLKKENETVKKDQYLKELQVEKLTQYWTLTQQQLQTWERRAVEMEAKMQKLKVVHVEQVSVLHKRIAMLQLDTRLDKVVSTQTDPFGEDSDCTNMKSELIQTETEWDRGSVNEVLKSHDDQLAEIIAEIENAKIQAQSDYKFAVVQMEQGLREEHEEELRAVKDEKERQLEEMVRIQSEQLQQYQTENAETKAQLNAEINQLKVENHEIRADLTAKEEENETLNAKIEQQNNQYDSLNSKYKVLNHSYEKNKVDQNKLKKEGKTIADLRNRMEKIEEINEILLGEFKKLEQENIFQKRALNQLQQVKTPSEVSKTRSEHFGDIVDQIRRENGGIYIQ